MQCEDFHIRVNEILDDREDPSSDKDITEHVTQCKTCERDLRNYRQIAAVANTASAYPDRCSAIIEKKSMKNNRIGRYVGAAIAATLLLSLALPRTDNATNELASAKAVQVAAVPTPKSETETDLTPQSSQSSQPVEDIPVPAGVDGYLQPSLLSIRLFATTDWTHLAPKQMPFGVTVPTVETQWIQVVADEMSPVRDSVNSTMELIIRTLSSGTSGDTTALLTG